MAAGALKNRDLIQRRIGQIQARYPSVNDLYTIELKEEQQRWQLHWRVQEQKRAWREASEGAYLLRTNLTDGVAADLWTKYIQLTEAEAAFRALKSELAIRPLFHRLEPRIKAHILVAFLGYALWVTLKHLLRRKALNLSPAQALTLLSTLHSADIVLPTTDGREIRLRRITTPSEEQGRLLNALGITLPDRLQMNYECSADSATA